MKSISITSSWGLMVLELLGWQSLLARADQVGGAACTFVTNDQISPGLRLTPSTGGTVTTKGETGRIECVGSIEGTQVTGPGTGESTTAMALVCGGSDLHSVIAVGDALLHDFER
jgi:hypothetical protein